MSICRARLRNTSNAQAALSMEGKPTANRMNRRFFAPVTMTLTRGNSLQWRFCCIHRY